jgi:hypothetical protein
MLTVKNALQQAKRCMSLNTSLGKLHTRVVMAVATALNDPDTDFQHECSEGISVAIHSFSQSCPFPLALNVNAHEPLAHAKYSLAPLLLRICQPQDLA